MKLEQIEIEGITIPITRNGGKRIDVYSYYKSGTFAIVAPKKVTMYLIKKEMARHKNWIVYENAQMIKNKTKQIAIPNTGKNGFLYYLGKTYGTKTVKGKSVTLNVFEGVFEIGKDSTPETLINWYVDQTRRICEPILRYYEKKVAKVMPHVPIRNWHNNGPKKLKIAKVIRRTVHATCGKHINIQYRLVMYPMQVIDYLIAHEVAHYKVGNHGDLFWTLTEELCSNCREKQEALQALSGVRIVFN